MRVDDGPPHIPHRHNNNRPERDPIGQDMNLRDPDVQLLKNIMIDSPFDGTLDSQVFMDCIKGMDSYFNLYNISEARKVGFLEMKLTGRVIQYLINLENMRSLR